MVARRIELQPVNKMQVIKNRIIGLLLDITGSFLVWLEKTEAG
jgi:hypothetical protein